MTAFVLASASPRRHALLEGMGIPYSVIIPDIDESVRADEPPESYVQRLSQEKAQAVLPQVEGDAYILAADTTVIFEGEILGKPADEDEARRMLLRLRGQVHRVCTGFSLLYVMNHAVQRQVSQVVCSQVTMRSYAASEMERWIKSGHAFDKAGAYAIQSAVFQPVAHVEGSFNNVVGLPTEALQRALQEIGYIANEFNEEEPPHDNEQHPD